MLFPKIAVSLIYALPLWLWGVISFVAGVMFWYSTEIVSFPLFVQILAFLAGVKGLSLFFFPKHLMKKIMDWWVGISQIAIRVSGAAMLLLAYYLFSIIIF